MKVRVLTVADCPHARGAVERLSAALGGREAEVELTEVTSEAEAARLGMNGSPTILVDGIDPFEPPGVAAGLSCRLYRNEDGTVSGLPDEATLRRALAGTVTGRTAASQCCARTPPDALEVIGRAGRGRRAPAARGLRAVQQQILRRFAATGTPPGTETLEPVAAGAGRSVTGVLAELAAEDFLTLDDGGNIRAAYPFSAMATRHRVRLDSGVEVWSMCAVDALGIPAMLGRDAVILSTDPVSGGPVSVASETGTLRWEPASAVVFVGQRPGGGSAATACCDAVNFFTDAANARAWARRHPDVPGRVVDQPDAERIGRQTFGPLLEP